MRYERTLFAEFVILMTAKKLRCRLC